jgi:hypothetical protein
METKVGSKKAARNEHECHRVLGVDRHTAAAVYDAGLSPGANSVEDHLRSRYDWTDWIHTD